VNRSSVDPTYLFLPWLAAPGVAGAAARQRRRQQAVGKGSRQASSN